MPDPEQVLEGGNATTIVVRVGNTVRKPWTAATPAVIEFMSAVRSSGVDVPKFLGRDEQDRQVLEFIPGQLAMDSYPLVASGLGRAGAIVRAIHDASDGFVPTSRAHWAYPIASPGCDLICHGDLAPWNLIIGERWVFIDWDGSSPSTRLWDLAYAALAFTLTDVSLSPSDAAEQLAAFAGGYGADETLRVALPKAITQRAHAMYELLRSSHRSGVEPWASMFAGGHGEHWNEVLEYVDRHRDIWTQALTAGSK